MLIRILPIALLVSLFACCAGCGGGDSRVPVEGVITLDGKAMPDIQVLFDQPELSPRENKGYMGKTDQDGRYVLRSMGEDTGVPPGTYRVSLTTYVDPTAVAKPEPGVRQTTIFYPEAPPPPPERVPPAYRGGKLSFTVPEDGTDQANFELKSK